VVGRNVLLGPMPLGRSAWVMSAAGSYAAGAAIWTPAWAKLPGSSNS
jgi:hypothetical protein